MAKVIGAIVVDVEKCKGCELCVVSCPTDVISIADNVNGKGYHYAYMKNPDACTGCTNCGIVCPDGVITVYRKKIELTTV
ncbi:MAG: 4Fe-4S binding protein [Bacteroidales bacterium]|nr:MAG: 4Fe-4S binding protein [Bacteroidales bacterium]